METISAAASLSRTSPNQSLPNRETHIDIRGFTLMELVIVFAIIAALAVVAIPSYESQMVQGRRSDGATALTTFSQRMERHFLESGSYQGATTAIYREQSPQGHYQLSVTATTSSYQLQATPIEIQEEDEACGAFSLNERGERGISGTQSVALCWGY